MVGKKIYKRLVQYLEARSAGVGDHAPTVPRRRQARLPLARRAPRQRQRHAGAGRGDRGATPPSGRPTRRALSASHRRRDAAERSVASRGSSSRSRPRSCRPDSRGSLRTRRLGQAPRRVLVLGLGAALRAALVGGRGRALQAAGLLEAAMPSLLHERLLRRAGAWITARTPPKSTGRPARPPAPPRWPLMAWSGGLPQPAGRVWRGRRFRPCRHGRALPGPGGGGAHPGHPAHRRARTTSASWSRPSSTTWTTP